MIHSFKTEKERDSIYNTLLKDKLTTTTRVRKLDYDEAVSASLAQREDQYEASKKYLDKIRLPRTVASSILMGGIGTLGGALAGGAKGALYGGGATAAFGGIYSLLGHKRRKERLEKAITRNKEVYPVTLAKNLINSKAFLEVKS